MATKKAKPKKAKAKAKHPGPVGAKSKAAKLRTSRTSRARAEVKTWDRFLAALLQTRKVTLACKAVGVGRTGAYKQREQDPSFAEAWDEALEVGIDAIEEDLLDKALNGWWERTIERIPVDQVVTLDDGTKQVTRTYREELTKSVHRWSPGLSQWLLTRRRARIYNDRVVAAEALRLLGYDPNAAASTGVLVVPAGETPDEWIERQRRENENKKAPGGTT